MYRNLFIGALLSLAVFCVVYGVYRSTIEQITTTENGNQVVYNQPQHGLLLGLCLLAGISILGAVKLFKENRHSQAHQSPMVHQEPVAHQPVVTARPGGASYMPK